MHSAVTKKRIIKNAPIPTPPSPNKLAAFFVVAMNTDIFKLYLPWNLIKIHFKMHQIAIFFQNVPGEQASPPTNTLHLPRNSQRFSKLLLWTPIFWNYFYLEIWLKYTLKCTTFSTFSGGACPHSSYPLNKSGLSTLNVSAKNKKKNSQPKSCIRLCYYISWGSNIAPTNTTTNENKILKDHPEWDAQLCKIQNIPSHPVGECQPPRLRNPGATTAPITAPHIYENELSPLGFWGCGATGRHAKEEGNHRPIIPPGFWIIYEIFLCNHGFIEGVYIVNSVLFCM